MKPLLIFITVSLISFLSFSQKTFTGIVSDENGTFKISYATVGLIKENIGINADENGYFSLRSLNPKLNDTLIISSVGFKTQKIAITNNLEPILNIFLVPQIISLEEVSIKPKNDWTNSTLNDFSTCGYYYIGSNGYLMQLAQHFISPIENSRLKEIKICITSGRPKKAFFRIRVYGIDTLTGGPGKNLCNKIIEVTTKKTLVKVNVELYKIRIPNKDFFVAVEWMKIPINEQFFKNNADKGELQFYSYAPSIAYKEAINSNLEAWELNYNGIWQPLSKTFKTIRTILISAQIKY